jgi:hypothetical protein
MPNEVLLILGTDKEFVLHHTRIQAHDAQRKENRMSNNSMDLDFRSVITIIQFPGMPIYNSRIKKLVNCQYSYFAIRAVVVAVVIVVGLEL